MTKIEVYYNVSVNGTISDTETELLVSDKTIAQLQLHPDRTADIETALHALEVLRDRRYMFGSLKGFREYEEWM